MLIAAVALAVLAVAAAGIARLSDIRVVGAVSGNWRGPYDILVTPLSSGIGHSAARTDGLIEPDFIAYQGRAGISLAQLQAIRRIPGVSVAAPISFVGYLMSTAVNPNLFIGASSLPSKPTLYRVTLTITTSDGVRRIPIETSTIYVVLDAAIVDAAETGPQLLVSGSKGVSIEPTGVQITLPTLPPQVNPVEAVDPGAERHLLGASARFLKRLSVGKHEATVHTFPVTRIPHNFPLARVQLGNLSDPSNNIGTSHNIPVFPILVDASLPYPMTMSAVVEQIGQPLSSYPQVGTTPGVQIKEMRSLILDQGSSREFIGRSRRDLGRTLRAYEPASFTIRWPGSTKPSGTAYSLHSEGSVTPKIAKRARYRRDGNGRYVITPTGKVQLDGTACPAPPVSRGCVESYRSFTSIQASSNVHLVTFAGTSISSFLAPVGSFNLRRVRLPLDPLDYVPLGAYRGATAVTMVDGAEKVVHSTENPLGFLTAPPDVITNMDAAKYWRGAAPIDAIRVRVSHIGGFSLQSRERIEGVADAIANLGGVSVRVVAGSSPRRVRVYVPGYSANGTPLGWVTEQWTSLGAAQRSTTALTHGEVVLLAMMMLMSGVLVVAAFVVDTDSKRQNVRIWTSLGWSRTRQVWWLWSDPGLAALGVVAAAIVGGSIVGHSDGTVVIGVGGGAALLAVGGVVAVAVQRQFRRERRGPSRTPLTFGLRPRSEASLAALTLLRDAALVIPSVVSGAVSGVALALLASSSALASREAGVTLLATYLKGQLRWLHFSALVLVIVVGTMAALVFGNIASKRRRRDIQSLSAVGWSRKSVAKELRFERFIEAVIIIVVAVAMSRALGASQGLPAGEWAAAGMAPAAVFLIGGELTARRLIRGVIP